MQLRDLPCVVLGGGGFVGGAVCAALASQGAHVRGFGRSPFYSGSQFSGIPWVAGDFSDDAAVTEALTGARCVFHLLGTSVPAISEASPANDVLNNVVPTLRLLDRCVALRVEKIVYMSSGGTVYGPSRATPIPETAPTRPISAYGAGKLAIEAFLEVYRSKSGLDYRILRAGNVFGPRQRGDRPQGIVAAFLHRIFDGRPIQIWGDGSVVRDFVYVEDLAAAVLKVACYEGVEQVFNIGSGVGRSILEVIDDLAKVTALQPEVIFTAARATDIPANVLDITRARTELGWAPETAWLDGLRETAAWLRSLRQGANSALPGKSIDVTR